MTYYLGNIGTKTNGLFDFRGGFRRLAKNTEESDEQSIQLK